MAAPSLEVELAVLAPTTRVRRRCEIYEFDGSTLWMEDAPMIGGSVNVDLERDERRTLDITFFNEEGEMSSTPDGFWYDKIIRPYRGVYYTDPDTGEELVYETSLGMFQIDSIDAPRFPHNVKVQGRDFTKKLILDKFPSMTLFTEGEAVEDVIKAIALNGGIDNFVLPGTLQNLDTELVFDRGTPRWEAIKEIATAYGWEVYFDVDGFFRMREFQDPTLSPVEQEFTTGEGGNMVDYSKVTNDTRIYNHVVVSGENADQTPIFAEAENNEASSPTRIERLGRRTYEYESALITTVQQAQDLADKFLKVMALESFEVSISSLVLPWLGAGNIIKFNDPNPVPTDPERFLLSSLTIPLGLSEMEANGKRVTIVG